MRLKFLQLLIIFFFAGIAYSQDVHYSYYQFAPTVVNPAFTGAYYGNIRATAINRGQWFNVRGADENGNQGFTSTSLLVDGNLPFGFKEGDWVSLGINMLIEGNTAGALDTKRSFSGLSLSYHLGLSKKNNSVLTAALKYGSYGIAFNKNTFAETPHSLSTGQEDTDLNKFYGTSTGNNVKDDTNDWMFGLMLTTPVGKSADMRIGIAADHLLAPRFAPDTSAQVNPNLGDRLNRRLNAFVQYYTDISDNLMFNPSIVYQKMGKASNILLQGLMAYTPTSKQNMTFNFGLGVRIADNMDIPFFVGVDFKDWRVGMAFDTNVSGLTAATGNAGAYELAVSKIFSWEKKATIKPLFICPRL